ncbi:MAG TPA: DUF4124 domain-containing protein [Burkholderiales bacterium]
MKRLAWILLIAVAGPAYSGVYKWMDEKGNVHYSDQPVGEAQKLRIQSNPQPAAAAER